MHWESYHGDSHTKKLRFYVVDAHLGDIYKTCINLSLSKTSSCIILHNLLELVNCN